MEKEIFILDLHYYFKDKESHSMNAFIFNECEKHFITALRNLNKFLTEPIQIDVIPSEVGGYNSKHVIRVASTIGLVLLTSFSNSFFQSKFRSRISITEETRNRIDIVKDIRELIENGLTDEEFEYIVSNDKSLKSLKNKFFKKAIEEKRIDKLEFSGKTFNNLNNLPLLTVNYSDFLNCVEFVQNEVILNETRERIFIVSPVLTRESKFHWRGLRNGKLIRFKIQNNDYLEYVYNHQIKFTNGSYIDCILEEEKVINYNEDKTDYNYFINTIFESGTDEDGITKLNPEVKNKPKSEDVSQLLFFKEEK